MRLTRDLGLVYAAAFFGMVNGMGRDRGGAVALEQAMLPETVSAERRTWALAFYNLALDTGGGGGGARGAAGGGAGGRRGGVVLFVSREGWAREAFAPPPPTLGHNRPPRRQAPE